MKTKINVKKAQIAVKYRKKGLSYREIATLMGEDVKSVYRWQSYFKAGKLSTGFFKRVIDSVGR